MIDRPALERPGTPLALPGRFNLSRQGLQVLLIILATALVTFLLYLYVLPNSQMSEARARIAELKLQRASLSRQNAAIKAEIAGYSDLPSLERRARQLGMGPPQRYVFLDMGAAEKAGTQVSSRPGVPTVEPGAAEPSQSLMPGLLAWFGTLRTELAAFVDQVSLWGERLTPNP